MAPLAGDVVNYALKKSGIVGTGQIADGDTFNDALVDLADMLAQWNEKRWLVWHLITLSITSTGAQFYSVGPGVADFPVNPRPAKIEAAYARQTPSSGYPVDYPLTIIPSMENYDRIAVKTLSAFPQYIFYDSASPLGQITTYPVIPANNYMLFVTFKDVYPYILTSQTDFSALPPFVIPAMKFCLAQRLRQAVGKGMNPDRALDALAQDALSTMRQAHAQVSELTMPLAVVQGGRNRYNVYSDQFY